MIKPVLMFIAAAIVIGAAINVALNHPSSLDRSEPSAGTQAPSVDASTQVTDARMEGSAPQITETTEGNAQAMRIANQSIDLNTATVEEGASEAALNFDTSGRKREEALRFDAKNEDVDSNWANTVEPQLESVASSYLNTDPLGSERFSVREIVCKTTVCVIKILDYGISVSSHEDQGPFRVQEEIKNQPWADEFDERDSHLLASNAGGLIEWSLFLRRLLIAAPD